MKTLTVLARGLAAVLVTMAALAGATPARAAAPPNPVSRLTGGTASSHRSSLSDDGRFVLYNVGSKNGYANDPQVLLLDRPNQHLQPVVADHAISGRLSADGSVAVYDQLGMAQCSGQATVVDVLTLWQRSNGATNVFSTPGCGHDLGDLAISADGQTVAYDLHDESAGTGSVFRYDAATATTTSIGAGNAANISENGRYLTYHSDTPLGLYLNDGNTGITTKVADGGQSASAVSNDGRFVTSADDHGSVTTIDRTSGVTTELTAHAAFDLDVTPDGRYVVFGANLTGDEPVAVWDRTTGVTKTITAGGGGGEPAISADGQFVTFTSNTSQGTPGDDTQGFDDIFLWSGAIASVPAAPTAPSVQPGVDQATLSWTAPADGGSPITGYRVAPYRSGVAQPIIDLPVSTTKTVTGLRGGESYTFTVSARSAGGFGLPSPASAAVTVKRSSAESFVTAANEDYIGRAPTEGELVSGLATVGDASSIQLRAQFTTALAQSDTYLGAVVNKLYLDTLGRPGDPGGVAYWTNQLGTGQVTVAQTAGLFYASPEYFAGYGANDLTTWVTDLYHKVLLRNPDQGGLDYYVNLARTTNRYTVAYPFYQSLESSNTRVKALYLHFLSRPADQGGLDYWANKIPTLGDVALASNLTLSSEYFSKAATRYP